MSTATPASPSATAALESSEIRRLANAIRALSMDAVQKAKSGHPGLPLGMADVATVLFSRFLKFDPKTPHWPDRDRFVLSGGHGSMLLYSLLYLTGYDSISLKDLENFRQVGSPTAGHPEYGHAAGIETTTGPLGQGIATAVGMALAERILNARFGDDLVDHKTYVIASDGDLMEGVSHEAIGLAGHLRLSQLVVLWDDNSISIDGDLKLSNSTNTIERFEAAGWVTKIIDGHDAAQVATALEWAQNQDRPVMIACKTIIGFGMPNRQGTQKAHSDAPGEEEIAAARKELNWPYEPFVIPDDVLSAWRAIGARGAEASAAWTSRKSASDKAAAFDAAMEGDVPASLTSEIAVFKKKMSEEKPSVATRKASQNVLEIVNVAMPETVGGSADLTPSNNTLTKGMQSVSPGNFAGRYIHYGIREHGMVAAMNGMALHGGVVPYGGTFLVFSDYARPVVRLAALMGVRVIYVLTHDSIGLGEDGPTHQPVEHLASLRAMPGLYVFRPADAVETAECWQMALAHKTARGLLALTRQNLPTVRTSHTDENLSAKGAYELAPAEGKAQVTLLATGSEVELALAARDLLQETASPRASSPCRAGNCSRSRTRHIAKTVLGPGTVKVAVEAGVRLGWDRYIGPDGAFVGMHAFGASATLQGCLQAFRHYAEAVAEAAKAALAAAK